VSIQTFPGQANAEVCRGFRSSFERLILDFIDRMQSEQAEARRQVIKRRQMLNRYHQETIDGMPLQQRLKTGNYRC